jgi:xanthosine utilization system XapX-like protein
MVGVVELFDQALPEAALELRVTEPPEQKVVGPLGVMVGVAGVAFTVTVTGAEAGEVQPPDVVVTVNVPLDATLMAGVVALFDHVLPEEALELRVTDPPEQKLVGPLGVMVGVAGVAFTVTVTGAEVAEPHSRRHVGDGVCAAGCHVDGLVWWSCSTTHCRRLRWSSGSPIRQRKMWWGRWA